MEILTQLTNPNIAQQINRYNWKNHLDKIHKILIKKLEWKLEDLTPNVSCTTYKLNHNGRPLFILYIMVSRHWIKYPINHRYFWCKASGVKTRKHTIKYLY